MYAMNPALWAAVIGFAVTFTVPPLILLAIDLYLYLSGGNTVSRGMYHLGRTHRWLPWSFACGLTGLVWGLAVHFWGWPSAW